MDPRVSRDSILLCRGWECWDMESVLCLGWECWDMESVLCLGWECWDMESVLASHASSQIGRAHV